MTRPVVGRLAPSPTGLLHVGNARSLLLAWLSARAAGGRVLLRIEDLLPGEEHVDAVLADLDWLGLDWDEAPALTGLFRPPGRPAAIRQSERSAVYRAILATLERAGRVFPCICTRRDIEAAARAPHAEDQGTPYPGICRGAWPSELHAEAAEAARAAEAGRSPLGVAWRLQVADAPVAFTDRLHGDRAVLLTEHSGDIVVRRKDGGFAYMLAAVADDLAMGVTEVVRGDDLLDCTAQQVAVYEALARAARCLPGESVEVQADTRRAGVRRPEARQRHVEDDGRPIGAEALAHRRSEPEGGAQPGPAAAFPHSATDELLAFWERARAWEPPDWVHVPLVLGDDGRRLAKRNRSLHVHALREAGVSAERLRRWLAASLGLPDTPHPAELVAAFDWRHVPRGPVVFGAAELAVLTA